MACWSIWDIEGCGCGLTFCGCSGLPTTGTLTSDIFGPFAMTYNAGPDTWTGTITGYAYPGNAFCTAQTIDIDVTIACVGGLWSLYFGFNRGVCVGGFGGNL